MTIIKEYPLSLAVVNSGGVNQVSVPKGAIYLKAMNLSQAPTLLYEVDSDETTFETFPAYVVELGQKVPSGKLEYMGSVRISYRVYSIYRELEPAKEKK